MRWELFKNNTTGLVVQATRVDVDDPDAQKVIGMLPNAIVRTGDWLVEIKEFVGMISLSIVEEEVFHGTYSPTPYVPAANLSDVPRNVKEMAMILLHAEGSKAWGSTVMFHGPFWDAVRSTLIRHLLGGR